MTQTFDATAELAADQLVRLTALQMAEIICSTGRADQVGTIMYAVGWTMHTVGTQIIGTLSYAIFAFVASAILIAIIKATAGIRVSAEEEEEGLDIGEHGQPSYADFHPIHN